MMGPVGSVHRSPLSRLLQVRGCSSRECLVKLKPVNMEYPMPCEDGSSDNSLNFFSFSDIWGWSAPALLPWHAAAVEQLDDRTLCTPEDHYFHSSSPPSWPVQEPASFQSDTNVQWEHSSRRSLPSASPDPSELTRLDVSPVRSQPLSPHHSR